MRIMLCCGAGMSSGILANQARKIIRKKKLDASVEAISQSDVGSFLGSIDILMIGPHYANQLEKYRELAAPHKVPVVVIPQEVYAQLDGQGLLDLAYSTIK